MPNIANMHVAVTGSAAGVKSAMKEGEAAVQSFGSKYKSTLKDLKSSFGKSSALGQSLKIMAGGGAIAGFAGAAHQIEAMTEKWAELSKGVRDGSLSYGDAIHQIQLSIPILGSMTQAGENIRELWTHEKADAEEAEAALKKWNDALEAHRKIATEIAADNEKHTDSMRGMRQELQMMTLTGDARKYAEINNKLADNLRDIQKHTGMNALSGDEQKRYAAIQKQMKDMGASPSGDNDKLVKYNQEKMTLQKELDDLNARIKNAGANAAQETIGQNLLALAQKGEVFADKWAEVWGKIGKAPAEQAKEINGAMASLRDELNMSGLDKYESMAKKFSETNPSDKQQAEYQHNLDRLKTADKAAEEKERLKSMGKSLAESTRTPMEAFAAKAKDLQEALFKGFIDHGIFDRAMGDAQEELKRSLAPGETKRASLVEARASFTVPTENKPAGAADMVQVANSTLQETQKQTRLMTQQNKLLETSQMVVVDISKL